MERIHGVLGTIIRGKGLRMTYVAEQLGMSSATFYRKVARPDTFTLSQALTICQLIGVSDFDVIRSLFFAKGSEKLSRKTCLGNE